MAQKSIDPIKITQDYLDSLKEKIEIKKAILFGSAARGQFTRDSDLDIIVISPDFKKMEYMDRLKFLSKARGDKFIYVPMDILGYTEEEFEKITKESVVLEEAKREGKEIKYSR